MIAMKVTQIAALDNQDGVLLFLAATFVLMLQDKLLIHINPKVTDVRVENVIDTSFMNKLESSGFIQSVYKKH